MFDRYINGSLKARTRNKRTSGKEVHYQISDSTNIANITLKQFLSHTSTKQELTIYLANSIGNVLNNKKYAITYDITTVTNIENFDDSLLHHDHEEADTLLILHAIDIGTRSPFSECYILSPDTDVFLLLVHYNEQLPQATFFRTGKAENVRDISIKLCYKALGPDRARALLGFHTFTGCDQIGRFNGKSKTAWWKLFMKIDESVINALATLGNTVSLPNIQTLEHIERFVALQYGGESHNIYNLSNLRWFLFSKFQNDTDKLPPTSSALKYRIFRCHFVSMVLKRSHLPEQRLPSPEAYGWEREGDTLVPIMTGNLPAPLALIELSVCKCKSNCSTKRCKCFKNDLVCTDMCKCSSCENDGNRDDADDESDVALSSDEDI